MLNCCIFCMNLPLLIFQQAFCCPILKQWSWKLAAGSLFIFSLQHPRLLQSHIHTWYLARCAFGKLGEAIRLPEDCGRVALSVREERLSAPPADRHGAPLKYCQLLLLKLPCCQSSWDAICQICGIRNSLCLRNWYILSIFTECQLKSPRTTFWQW